MRACAVRRSAGTTYVLGVALFVYILAAAFAFTQVFNGRAAFLHTGAMIATWMSASVFFIIIPNQKKVVAELLAGRSPDPKLGKEAKLRSTHNNYLTLPVIFLMLSNHYPLAWSSRYAVAIIGLIVIAGAVIRHFFNSQHAGKGSPWWTWAVAALCICDAQSGCRSSASPATPTWRTLRPPRRRRRSPPPSTRRCSPSSPAAPCAMRPSRSGTASPSRRRASASTRPRRSPAMRRSSASRACSPTPCRPTTSPR